MGSKSYKRFVDKYGTDTYELEAVPPEQRNSFSATPLTASWT